MEDPRRDEMEHELTDVGDDGVAGVVAAVVAGHDLDPVAKQVDDLSFAFVAPLGAGDHDVGHGTAIVRARLRAPQPRAIFSAR